MTAIYIALLAASTVTAVKLSKLVLRDALTLLEITEPKDQPK